MEAGPGIVNLAAGAVHALSAKFKPQYTIQVDLETGLSLLFVM